MTFPHNWQYWLSTEHNKDIEMRFFKYFFVILLCSNLFATTVSVNCPTKIITGSKTLNLSPVSDAGADMTAIAGDVITLNGSDSFDCDGIITYKWILSTRETEIAISDADQPIATFIAPDIVKKITFKLEVTDDNKSVAYDKIVVDVSKPVIQDPIPETIPTVGDYYVSNCLTGADDDCVAGNDSNDGKSPATAWKTLSTALLKIPSGKTVLFAKGGVFSPPTRKISRSNFTLAEYQPNWGSGDELEPMIIQSSNKNILEINPGHGKTQSNINISNMRFICTTGTNVGIFFWMKSDDVTFDNIEIYGCATGIQFGNPDGFASERFTLKNSTIKNNTNQGFLGSGNKFTFNNNVFTDNGTQSGTNHNFYFDKTSVGLRLNGNTFEYKNIECNGTNVVIHGVHSSIKITDNNFDDSLSKSGAGCWPLAVATGYHSAESFTDVLIKGNTIYTNSNTSIGLNSCKNCLIIGNTVVGAPIKVPLREPGKNDIITTALIISDNIITAGTCIDNRLPAGSYTETNNSCN